MFALTSSSRLKRQPFGGLLTTEQRSVNGCRVDIEDFTMSLYWGHYVVQVNPVAFSKIACFDNRIVDGIRGKMDPL